MEQKIKSHSFINSLPFYWVVLTVIYLISSFMGIGWDSSPALTLGLFVPIGFWNFGYSLTQMKWFITFPLVLVTIFGGEKYLRKMDLSPIVKTIIILGILFILTIVVDFVIWGKWQSLELLKAGGL